jgi:hypothetical protein
MQGYKQETIIKLKDTNCLDIEILNLFVACFLCPCIFLREFA